MTPRTTNLVIVPGFKPRQSTSRTHVLSSVSQTFYFLLTVKNHFIKPSIGETGIGCAQITEGKVTLDLLARTWAGSPIQRPLPKWTGPHSILAPKIRLHASHPNKTQGCSSFKPKLYLQSSLLHTRSAVVEWAGPECRDLKVIAYRGI